MSKHKHCRQTLNHKRQHRSKPRRPNPDAHRLPKKENIL